MATRSAQSESVSSVAVRRQFIDFFVERCGHTAVPSSPVVPHDDPTLLFTNAGMNQFKDVFLGVGSRPYTRAVNTQKCIRAGGKHNDLEDVGKDTYHHTFFEMLGNWSFGDYFKAEAIEWAWKLLTEVWGIEKGRLYATVFAGDASDGLEPDTEAEQLWKRVTDIDPSHISRWGRKDNFWEMGETGPCGPCSEIHVDLTPDRSGASRVNRGDPQVIEIWNLVFIQFNRNADGSLSPLPAKHVDTGMGLERLVRVLQGKSSNYDTDIFVPLFEAIESLSGAAAYTGDLVKPADIAYRVIADHIRTLTFALADGAHCGNDGRSYVLRRILRRAVRYGRQTLGVDQPFLYRLSPVVVKLMGDVFPELKKNPEGVAEEIRQEEESFIRTLDRGIELFNKAASDGKVVSADDAFKLHDTYGFPLDLTQLMAEERGMTVDVAGFHALMEQARQKARAAAGGGEARDSLVTYVQQQAPPATRFAGYESMLVDEGRIERVLKLYGQEYRPAEKLVTGDEAAIILDQTPFYAEAGGQVGDTGAIHTGNGGVFRVDDTLKIGETYFHVGQVEAGPMMPSEDHTPRTLAEVDQPRRRRIMGHHTATHLLNWALREVLGDHVQQKGSLVDADKTRFDFSNPAAVSTEQIEKIESLVNDRIEQGLTVYAAHAPQEQALKIRGLRAVFGEKYPPVVRVVSIGRPVADLLADPDREEWMKYSIEFCGGTHLATTKSAGRFVIVSEEAVAKGVRRITAVAGEAAASVVDDAEVLDVLMRTLKNESGEALERGVSGLAEALNLRTLPLTARVKLREELAALQERVKQHRKEQEKAAAGDVVGKAKQIAEGADGPLLVAVIEGASAATLRTAMDVIRARRPEAAMMLAAVEEDKIAFLASVPPGLIEKGLKAGDWVREVAKAAGGGGGGRPDMAQAGGKDVAKLDEALETARRFAAERIL